MPWNGKYMDDAMLDGALAASASAANGLKNAAFAAFCKSQLGTNVRLRLYRDDVVVYAGIYTGDLPLSGGRLTLPTSFSQSLLSGAVITTGAWWMVLESAANAAKYLSAPVTPSAGAGPVRLSKDLVGGDTLVVGTVTFDSPALDTVVSFDLVAPNQSLVWSSLEAQRLIGRGLWVWDDLVNLNVFRNGSTDNVVSTRFRALSSGMARFVQIWFQDGPGYASGNGGTARFRVFPDNGSGSPNMAGAAMAQAIYVVQGMSGGVFSPRNASQLFPTIQFTSTTALTAGQLYHVVVDNVAADPINNWFCQDNAMCWVPQSGMPINRWLSPNEWGALVGVGPVGGPYTWTDTTIGEVPGGLGGKSLPFMMLYIGGAIQGLMSVSSANPGNSSPTQWLRSSNAPIRERYIPSENISVVGASFLANVRVAGSALVEFKTGNTVLASTTVTQTPANESTFTDPYSGTVLQRPAWYDVKFSAVVSMVAGTIYDLTITPQGSSQWRFWDMRNGRDYSVMEPTSGCNSYAQHWRTEAGRWFGTNGYNEADDNRDYGNWLMLLHRA
jgi:hypothetical protein